MCLTISKCCVCYLDISIAVCSPTCSSLVQYTGLYSIRVGTVYGSVQYTGWYSIRVGTVYGSVQYTGLTLKGSVQYTGLTVYLCVQKPIRTEAGSGGLISVRRSRPH